MVVGTGHHCPDQHVWIRRLGIPVVVSRGTTPRRFTLRDGCTPVMHSSWIVLPESHNVAHLLRIVPQNVIDLHSKGTEKNMRSTHPLKQYATLILILQEGISKMMDG